MSRGVERSEKGREVAGTRRIDCFVSTRRVAYRSAESRGMPWHRRVIAHLRVNEAFECDFVREPREQRVVLLSPHDENHPGMRCRGQ
jgi:hypothetical protein